jgi:proline iminopeptidase
MVLRGVFLAREEDIAWAFSGGGGSRIFADYWQEYLSAFPVENSEVDIKLLYDIMVGNDEKAAMNVAKAWSTWESRCCTLKPNKSFVDLLTSGEKYWALARHEAHFMVNQFFISEDHILNNCYKISHIPTIIVHGRYDIVCPFENAWNLHQALPSSQLTISETAGHASIEPETIHHLIHATSKIFENLTANAG